MTKICKRCGKELPVEKFYFFSKMGCYFSECKECLRKRNNKYAKENNYKCQINWANNHPEYMRLYSRNRYYVLKERIKNKNSVLYPLKCKVKKLQSEILKRSPTQNFNSINRLSLKNKVKMLENLYERIV
jgi:hypothetical protein